MGAAAGLIEGSKQVVVHTPPYRREPLAAFDDSPRALRRSLRRRSSPDLDSAENMAGWDDSEAATPAPTTPGRRARQQLIQAVEESGGPSTFTAGQQEVLGRAGPERASSLGSAEYIAFERWLSVEVERLASEDLAVELAAAAPVAAAATLVPAADAADAADAAPRPAAVPGGTRGAEPAAK
ncbi:hypothetical protein N2152v2_007059 [Parachlorella kessleri]